MALLARSACPITGLPAPVAHGIAQPRLVQLRERELILAKNIQILHAARNAASDAKTMEGVNGTVRIVWIAQHTISDATFARILIPRRVRKKDDKIVYERALRLDIGRWRIVGIFSLGSRCTKVSLQ